MYHIPSTSAPLPALPPPRASFPRTPAQTWACGFALVLVMVSLWVAFGQPPAHPTAPTPWPVLALGDVLLVFAGVALLVAYGWFVFWPWRIARRRQHPQAQAIWWLSALFGWGVLGWGIAMIWAHTATEAQETTQAQR